MLKEEALKIIHQFESKVSEQCEMQRECVEFVVMLGSRRKQSVVHVLRMRRKLAQFRQFEIRVNNFYGARSMWLFFWGDDSGVEARCFRAHGRLLKIVTLVLAAPIRCVG